MDTITIINPVRQARLENWIEATKKAIEYNRKGIAWAKLEIAWAENNLTVWPALARNHLTFAKGELAAYEIELKKAEEHLEELQRRLSEEIEKPLS